MFGYIKPFKPEMKIKEFDTYKAIYCGLCKQMGRDYGQWARFTLSYDFTFVALLSLALHSNATEFKSESCIANPLKKKPCMVACGDLGFASALAMVMIYYKLEDNYKDGKFFDKLKVLLVLPLAKSALKKTKAKYDYIAPIISKCMKEQALVESEDVSSIDRSANPSATALASALECLSDDSLEKRVLNRLGYLMGRYVYFIDALDDIEDDKKSGNFNVFLNKIKDYDENINETEKLKRIKDYAKEVINLTVGEIASTYELLDIKRYKTILNNIFYLGLHDSLDKVSKGIAIEKEK